ncbi:MULTISPECIES: hypothetical protein [Streptomycetaceae]|uniref:hypothetical protein n=1 Tax=Streptomycetaceae TaxID=2062 RepID=UPI001F51F607|nr:hypothetical protein [Streptomyces sp. CB02056]
MAKKISKKLAAALARDNDKEDAGMHADDRETCFTHQAWAGDCESRHVRPTAESILFEALYLDSIRNDRA